MMFFLFIIFCNSYQVDKWERERERSLNLKCLECSNFKPWVLASWVLELQGVTRSNSTPKGLVTQKESNFLIAQNICPGNGPRRLYSVICLVNSTSWVDRERVTKEVSTP